ncbi:MAG: DUF4249 family protein [Bacteroidia bacterium]|nr:DUF4249 family protein [Bacteroidia bacterium]
MKNLYLLIFCLVLTACSESVEINAPYKDIWVVYGVLNPQEKFQYIRISRAFQAEENAWNYAAANDQSVKGLKVSLTGENGEIYNAVQLDSVLKDTSEGDFFPYATLYRFETDNDEKLKEEKVYHLKIENPEDADFFLSAHTRIPPQPRITAPLTTTARGRKCLPIVRVEDSVYVYFNKHRGEVKTSAMRFEIQVLLNFWKDGIRTTFKTRPTPLFNNDVNCLQTGDNALCYQFKDGVLLSRMKGAFADKNASYLYEDTPLCGTPWTDLPNFVELQITAVDTFLSKYIISNDPSYLNLNTIRWEYSNIAGSASAVGIFGSVASDREAVAMTPCALYLLGLTPDAPSNICD